MSWRFPFPYDVPISVGTEFIFLIASGMILGFSIEKQYWKHTNALAVAEQCYKKAKHVSAFQLLLLSYQQGAEKAQDSVEKMEPGQLT